MYEDNPAGMALTWVAVDDETSTIAGITSYFPFMVWAEGQTLRGAIGGDGFVRPRFRRRGIASALHALAREDMDRGGIELMFGAPTLANIRPLEISGSVRVTDVVRYARPLIVPPWRGAERLEAMSAGDARVDALWAETRGELKVAVVRDARFYSWRFVRSPAQRQTAHLITDGNDVIACCAIERIGDRLRVIDLLAPARRWGRALSALARHGRQLGLRLIEMVLSQKDAAHRSLWRHGYIARESKPMLVALPSNSLLGPLLLDGRSWFFTGADSDMDTLDESQ
jgi:GNAT superfamily N-acetyltransferase